MAKIRIQLTKGNIKNDHIYLKKYCSFFPKDSFGSSNRNNGEGRKLLLHVDGLGSFIETDIASDKCIFRKRSWCRNFFNLWGLNEGDWVVIEKITEYEYKIYAEN